MMHALASLMATSPSWFLASLQRLRCSQGWSEAGLFEVGWGSPVSEVLDALGHLSPSPQWQSGPAQVASFWVDFMQKPFTSYVGMPSCWVAPDGSGPGGGRPKASFLALPQCLYDSPDVFRSRTRNLTPTA